MLTSFLESQKTFIFAKNSDSSFPVGIIVDFVINPDSGIFEAVWAKTPDGLRLIAPKDVLQWGKKMLISDENDLSTTESFPRIQKVIEREVPILKNRVFVRNKYVGKVYDFSFDTISPRIITLIVRSGFWLWSQERIIPRHKIRRITEKGIFVSENIIRSSEKNNTSNSKEEVPVPEFE